MKQFIQFSLQGFCSSPIHFSFAAAEDEDAAIEANTGDFTADDIKEALESRTPAMQALLRARPDES